jgi:hypothetical protein
VGGETERVGCKHQPRAIEVQRKLAAHLTTLFRKGEGCRPLRLQRWHDRLYWYPFNVEYKPGDINCIADMLSRNSVGAPDESDVDVWNIFGDIRVTLVTEKEQVEATAVDHELCEIKKCIRQGSRHRTWCQLS